MQPTSQGEAETKVLEAGRLPRLPLDYLSQTAIRMAGLVDVLREDDPKSASLAIAHGWLHVLLELRVTVDNMYMEIREASKTTHNHQ